MKNPFRKLFDLGTPKTAVPPTRRAGVGGTAVVGGYIVSPERDPELVGPAKYRQFSNLAINIGIVAAGVRGFLNLISSVAWKVEPAEDSGSKGEEIADKIQEILDDMRTPWHRVVRRAAMYKFHGFSVQEWTAKLNAKTGVIGFADIESRPQVTIEKWDVEESGAVLGMVQVSPLTGKEIYIPRAKTLYLVDDALNDSPEGVGLFRHLVAPAAVMARYEQLEGYGFETDLRGMPLGRAPFAALMEMQAQGKITEAERLAIEAPLKQFIQDHVRNPKLGLLLDSMPYESQDEAGTPSSTKQWDLELMRSESNAHEPIAAAIMRKTRELARILGVEHLLLGEGATGSYAMHKDKVAAFLLTVDSAMKELVEGTENDLMPVLFELNGWDEKYYPTLTCESIRHQDVVEITQALNNMAMAGAVLAPDDPAIDEIRDLLRLSRPTNVLSQLQQQMDLAEQQMASDEKMAASAAAAAAKAPKAPAAGAPAKKPVAKMIRGRGRLGKRRI